MRNRAYTHMVFDIDGTLVDSEAVVLEAYRALAKAYHVGEPNEEFLKKHCFIKTPREACRSLGITQNVSEAIRFLSTYAYSGERIHCFPNIKEMLEALRQKAIVLSACTARDEEEFLYDRLFPEIRPYFEQIMCSEYAARPKPAPDPLLDYMRERNLKKEEVLFIGDSATDCTCARDAGVDFALALWSGSADRALPAQYGLLNPMDVLPLAAQ